MTEQHTEIGAWGREEPHTLTEYGTTNCPVEGVRAEVDIAGCSACGGPVTSSGDALLERAVESAIVSLWNGIDSQDVASALEVRLARHARAACACGHDRDRHSDAAIAPECLDRDCGVYSSARAEADRG